MVYRSDYETEHWILINFTKQIIKNLLVSVKESYKT